MRLEVKVKGAMELARTFFLVRIFFSKLSFLSHWYSCFGFLVMSHLGFKARVGSALFAFSEEANVMCKGRTGGGPNF